MANHEQDMPQPNTLERPHEPTEMSWLGRINHLGHTGLTYIGDSLPSAPASLPTPSRIQRGVTAVVGGLVAGFAAESFTPDPSAAQEQQASSAIIRTPNGIRYSDPHNEKVLAAQARLRENCKAGSLSVNGTLNANRPRTNRLPHNDATITSEQVTINNETHLKFTLNIKKKVKICDPLIASGNDGSVTLVPKSKLHLKKLKPNKKGFAYRGTIIDQKVYGNGNNDYLTTLGAAFAWKSVHK